MISTTEKERQISFIKRTRENYLCLKQSTDYDVTLLINSSVGMLIFLKEKYADIINDSLLEAALLDDLLDCATPSPEGEDIVTSLYDFCRHLRNSIAHGNFDFNIESSGYKTQYGAITSVTFTDYNCDGEKNVEITISIELLEEFYLDLSEKVVEWIK